MRNDMSKVLTERTRGGGTWKDTFFDRANNFKYRDREILEDYGVEDDFRPTKEGIRKRYIVRYQDGKEFRDLLNPLKRFLAKQVGRPWNKVYSEICQVLKGNGVLQKHVKDHVKFEVDGISFSGQKYFSGEIGEPNSYPYRDSLYVDLNGILRLKRGKSLRKARKKNKRLEGPALGDTV